MVKYHVHAINWNESRFLPIFFRHYASADRIVIHDNESDRETVEIAKKAGAEVVTFSTKGTFNDAVHQTIKNTAWKKSRESADFVIVQDLDELLHFPWSPGDINGGLRLYKDLEITFAQSKAFDIVCSDEEWDHILSQDALPWKLLRRGRKANYAYDKIQVFSPKEIEESRYWTGAHRWDAVGNLRQAPEWLEPLMLHCKHIGQNYELSRRIAMKRRMSEINRVMGFSVEYQVSEEELKEAVDRAYDKNYVSDISSYADRGLDRRLTEDWSGGLKSSLPALFPTTVDRPFKILEIGCFEGRGTLAFLDRLCQHPDSKVYCVDPWADVYVKGRKEFSEFDSYFKEQYSRFLFNVRNHKDKVVVLRGSSNEIVPSLEEEFDLAYIDGDHQPGQVYQDAVMALRLMKPGGIILFDDRLLNIGGISPKDGMYRFVSDFSGCVDVKLEDAQLAVQVKETWTNPTYVRTRYVADKPPILLDSWGPGDAICSHLYQGRTWEADVALFIAKYFHGASNAAMLDVGANIGIHAIAAAKGGARHVFAFECHPESVKKLSNGVRLNRCQNVTVIPFAVSNKSDQVVRLGHIANNVGASCIENQSNTFFAHRSQVYECRTVALDWWPFSPPLESFDSILLKLDVEGHELEALQGMRAILARVDQILIEFSPYAASLNKLAALVSELKVAGWSKMETILSIPPDGWAGYPRSIQSELISRPLSADDLHDLMRKNVMLDVLVRKGEIA